MAEISGLEQRRKKLKASTGKKRKKTEAIPA